jgi:hypothetical protein
LLVRIHSLGLCVTSWRHGYMVNASRYRGRFSEPIA